MAISADSLETSTVRTVMWRIIPFVFLLYVINYIDRANIGYAGLQMNKELQLSSSAFGLAAGLFFIGYFLFEVPSNMALARFGARKWIARILISWGLVAALMAFAQNDIQLYVLRFLLGVAEAGFFPGIIVYLTYWFRSRELATATALFTAAIPVSYIIASPLSTFILDHVHWSGISGWRWMLLLEALPAVGLGFICYLALVERPQDAKWLTPQQKQWLTTELEAEHATSPDRAHLSTWKALTNPKVLYLAVIYFAYQAGSLGIGYWMPQIVKGFSTTLTNTQVGLIGMIPYLVATVAMIWWSRRSDRTGERKRHTYIPLGVGAVAMLAAGLAGSPVLAVVCISLALAGLYAFKAPFWAVPTLFLTRATAAVAVAAVNSVGNLGGFVGPYAIGVIKDTTHSKTGGLIFLSALVFIAFVMATLIRLRTNDHARATVPVTETTQQR
ncbi:MFS transporter [Nocardia pseudovaccinii]|uniref:MFS transporter n=1 Tax=Nocardia pseudovaccinii TaxID=189540 RepID=UPI000A4837D2|nr:MFS transporter [Nocardia pseudovaccinii]